MLTILQLWSVSCLHGKQWGKNDICFCENLSWTVYFAASIFKAERYYHVDLKKKNDTLELE